MPQLKPDGAAKLQNALDNFKTSFPGSTLSVASSTDILFQGATGPFDILDPASRAVSTDDVMWFASTTKLLTSICYLQLVDRGLLSLDTDMSTIYPPLAAAAAQILTGFDAEGKPEYTPNSKPVTLGSLLNQTSGFGREFGDKVPQWKKFTDKGKGFVNSCKVENLIHTPICFEPGSSYEYGNSAEWLGLILPSLVGVSTEEYLQTNVLKPLGANDTTFYPFSSKFEGRLMPLRFRSQVDGKDEWQILNGQMDLLTLPRTREEIEYPVAGGGIYSKSSDYILVLQYLLRHFLSLSDTLIPPPETKIISDESVRSLFKGTLPSAARPAMAEMLGWYFGGGPESLLQTGEADWSTGMAIYQPVDSRRRSGWGRLSGSVGWGGAAGTQYWIDPTSGIAVVFTTQMLPGSGPATSEFKDALEKAVYAALDEDE